MGLSAPSTGKAGRASPLNLASLVGRRMMCVLEHGDTPPKMKRREECPRSSHTAHIKRAGTVQRSGAEPSCVKEGCHTLIHLS